MPVEAWLGWCSVSPFSLSILGVRDMTGVRVKGESPSENLRPRSRSPSVQRRLGSTAIMRLSADRVSRGKSRKMESAAPEVKVATEETLS